MKKVFFNITLILYALSNAGISDIRIAYICPNDNKDSTGVPQIPDAFLTRAKINNYTHINVEYFLVNGTEMNSGRNDWKNGIYNSGIYNAGGLYRLLHRDIAKVKSFGMKFLPTFGIGCEGAHWSETGNKTMDLYAAGPKNVACIAPGKKSGTYQGQPTGFIKSFTDLCKVIEAACEANNYNLDFINLSYSEHKDSLNNIVWGTGKTDNAKSIDQIWINSASSGATRDVNDLVAASLEEKIAILHNDIGGRLSKTKIMVYGDMFSTEFQSALNIDLPTKKFLSKHQNNTLLKSNTVFIPWWYHRNKFWNQGTFDIESEFRQFTDAGFDIIYCRIICDGDNSITAETTSEDIPQLVEAIKTAKRLKSKHIIGFMSAHWDNVYTSKKPGYDNDLCWNTMEYFAYGTQSARPQMLFSTIPPDSSADIYFPGLLCSRKLVTQGDYFAATGSFPFKDYASGKLDKIVDGVSFYDAILFCNIRSKQDNLDSVFSYSMPETTDFKDESCTILRNLTVDTTKNGYRLLSPSEWTYIYTYGSTLNYWGFFLNNYSTTYALEKSQTASLKLSMNKWQILDIGSDINEITCNYSDAISPCLNGTCSYFGNTLWNNQDFSFRIVRKFIF